MQFDCSTWIPNCNFNESVTLMRNHWSSIYRYAAEDKKPTWGRSICCACYRAKWGDCTSTMAVSPRHLVRRRWTGWWSKRRTWSLRSNWPNSGFWPRTLCAKPRSLVTGETCRILRIAMWGDRRKFSSLTKWYGSCSMEDELAIVAVQLFAFPHTFKVIFLEA